MSITRGAYDASNAKLVSLVACRASRRFENQTTLRDQFHWLARFVFLNSVSAPLGVLLEAFESGLDCSGPFCERLGSFRNSLECFGSVLGSSKFTSDYVYS